MSITAANVNAAPSHRSDLDVPLTKVFCSGGKVELSSKALWQHGIYDSNVEGQLLRDGQSGSLAREKIKLAAEKFASRNYHNGYSFGRCDARSFWVATVPSAAALATKQGNSIGLDLSAAQNSCSALQVDYVAAKGGKVRPLKIDATSAKVQVHLDLLEAGTLSITCSAREPSWLGATTWFLYPVGSGPSSLLPNEDMLQSAQQSDEQKLQNWINAIRKSNSLADLALDHPQVNLLAQEFSKKNQTLRSDLRQAKVARGRLHKLLAKYVGEIRVRGQDMRMLAWQLWNSPLKRDLILSSKATHFAIVFSEQRSEKLGVLLFAEF